MIPSPLLFFTVFSRNRSYTYNKTIICIKSYDNGNEKHIKELVAHEIISHCFKNEGSLSTNKLITFILSILQALCSPNCTNKVQMFIVNNRSTTFYH